MLEWLVIEFLKYKTIFLLYLRYYYLFVDFQMIEKFCNYNFFFNDVEESLQLYSNGCLLSKEEFNQTKL